MGKELLNQAPGEQPQFTLEAHKLFGAGPVILQFHFCRRCQGRQVKVEQVGTRLTMPFEPDHPETRLLEGFL